jgi:CrcB protein
VTGFLALWLGVCAAGGVGALARFLVDPLISVASLRYPEHTLIVNVSGAAALGVVAGAGVHGDAYLLLGTALIGSYTTFSTWVYETERLSAKGHRSLAALNVALSVALGLGSVELGHAVGAALT